MTQNLVLVDCETCSLKGGIIELGTRKLSSLDELLSLSDEDFIEGIEQEYFKNPMPIDQVAYEVHGLTDDVLACYPLYDPSDFYKRFYVGEELAAVDELAQGLILVGHNVEAFDRSRLGLSSNHASIDTLRLAKLLDDFGVLTHNSNESKLGNKLDTLVALYCPQYAAQQQQWHSSVQDVYKTFLILRWLLTGPLPQATVSELIFLSSAQASKAAKQAVATNIRVRS